MNTLRQRQVNFAGKAVDSCRQATGERGYGCIAKTLVYCLQRLKCTTAVTYMSPLQPDTPCHRGCQGGHPLQGCRDCCTYPAGCSLLQALNLTAAPESCKTFILYYM